MEPVKRKLSNYLQKNTLHSGTSDETI